VEAARKRTTLVGAGKSVCGIREHSRERDGDTTVETRTGYETGKTRTGYETGKTRTGYKTGKTRTRYEKRTLTLTIED